MLVVGVKPPALVTTYMYSIAILLGFFSYRGYFRRTRIVPCDELQVLDPGLSIRSADFSVSVNLQLRIHIGHSRCPFETLCWKAGSFCLLVILISLSMLLEWKSYAMPG